MVTDKLCTVSKRVAQQQLGKLLDSSDSVETLYTKVTTNLALPLPPLTGWQHVAESGNHRNNELDADVQLEYMTRQPFGVRDRQARNRFVFENS